LPAASRQQPGIEDYALIGDCHGGALVSRAGEIDWCSLLRLDGDPIFFRLLDAEKGGSWTIEPAQLREVSRRYLERTNILETRFATATGVLEVVDFMPVGRARTATVHDYVTLNAPGWLVRRLRCVEGTVELTSRFAPRGSRFSTKPPAIRREAQRIHCDGGLTLWCDADVSGDDAEVHLTARLEAGETRNWELTGIEPLLDERERGDYLFDTTYAFWREWSEYSRYRGPYEDMVWRSALALKLMTYAPTGAMVAAPTTSLPEEIGGERNWDYRFSWIRDATFALFALSVLGYSAEGRRFSEFLTHRCLREGSLLRIMYGLDGESFLPESTLDQLSGYRGSRPVRTGNEAADQRQLDVFGELLDWAELRVALGARLSADERGLLQGIADHVCATWRVPDQGLWEIRCAPRHFTQGKAMAWVALDRALRLLGEKPLWRESRDAILQAILDEGCAGQPPYLAQSFGSSEVDAALLQVPLLGLPLDRGLIERTIRQIEKDLRADDLVHRYTTEDGLGGSEGAFFITSFWMVEALLAVGRAAEARELFERLLRRANDVGLYAEEIDPKSGAFLGNFPQAFTHLALISSASLLHLHEVEGEKGLAGTNTDRAKRLVGATEGFKALLFALTRNRSVRLFSSRKSVMALT